MKTKHVSNYLNRIVLFSSVTTLVPVGMLAFFHVPVLFWQNRIKKLHPIFKYTCIYLVFCLVYTLVYSPAALLDPAFYRRDGSIFISFAPFLSIPFMGKNKTKLVFYFVLFASFVNIVGLGVFYIQKQKEYFAFFTAHNAAALFLSVTSALSLGIAIFARRSSTRWFFYAMFGANFFGLFLSASRGSIITFVFTVFVSLMYRINKKLLLYVIIIVIIFQVLFIGYCYIYSKNNGILFNFSMNYDNFFEREYTSRDWTIALRMYSIWPKAVYLFLQSPWIGVGFGSFNDITGYPELIGILFFVTQNIHHGYLVFNSAHAHHSFLHVLSETGLVGMFIIILLFYEIYRLIDRVQMKQYRYGLLMAFLSIIFASLTEHGFLVPSVWIPFAILTSIFASNELVG